MAMLERPLRSSGELLYEAPDHLEKRTLEPRRETLILEHGVLTAQRGHRTHVLRLRDYPQVVPFVESIRATLAGDRAALEHYFHVQFSGDLGHWTLELVPIDATVARTVRDIRISGEREAIRSVEIRQSDGDRSLLTIGAEVPRERRRPRRHGGVGAGRAAGCRHRGARDLRRRPVRVPAARPDRRAAPAGRAAARRSRGAPDHARHRGRRT